MARLVGSSTEAWAVAKEVAGSINLRPARCVGKCGVGVARPVGGAGNHDMRCPICGGGIIQSTWGARAVRRGYVVLSKNESLALARGEKITVERPLTAGIAARMDIHEIYERVPTAPEDDLRLLNAEIKRRLDGDG